MIFHYPWFSHFSVFSWISCHSQLRRNKFVRQCHYFYRNTVTQFKIKFYDLPLFISFSTLPVSLFSLFCLTLPYPTICRTTLHTRHKLLLGIFFSVPRWICTGYWIHLEGRQESRIHWVNEFWRETERYNKKEFPGVIRKVNICKKMDREISKQKYNSVGN